MFFIYFFYLYHCNIPAPETSTQSVKDLKLLLLIEAQFLIYIQLGGVNKMASVLYTSPKGQIGVKCLAQEHSGWPSVWVK